MATKNKKSTPSTKPQRSAAASSSRPPEPDLRAARRLVVELMAIPGVSGQEGTVARHITALLRAAGASAKDIRTDSAHQKTPFNGEVGNLIFQLPGTFAAPRRLLMAHMDTVPLCVGSRPVVRGGEVRSADKTTGLGADNRAGCAVVLTAAIEILQRKLPHPPLTFFWPVQEEVGLYGARFVSLSELGKPRLAFNWDGGAANKVIIGATGAYRMTIDVYGIASHAGAAPEKGVSAITIAGLAIADLERNGWLGLIQRKGKLGTSNIGVISGGAAMNVVTPHVRLQAEARSHDKTFRMEIVKAFITAFENAASKVKNAEGAKGSVKCDFRLDYESFHLPSDSRSVVAAIDAVRSIGLEPMPVVSNGGLDANWMTERGTPTVTLGCGQRNVHTIEERLDLAEFDAACRIGLRLATATELAI